MFKRIIGLAAISVLTFTTLTGCGGAGKAADGSAAAGDGSQKVTIKFWDGNWSEPRFQEVKKMWEEQHPDIELVAEFQVDDGMSDKYMMSLQNGSAPDVVACALDWVSTFGNAGLLAPLDEYIEKDGVDTGMYVKGAIDASTIDGKLYGLPFRSETYGLYYNKDILAAAGYDKAPETLEEMKEIAKACTNDQVAGFGLCGANFSNFSFQYINMLRCAGGDVLNADATASALDTKEAVYTANLYGELAQYAPASLLENNNIANRTLFASGKIAMYLSGIYDMPEITKANPELNFGCAMVPVAEGAERHTLLGGWSVAIPECSKNKEAAWEFVKFITSSEVAALYTNTFTGTMEPSVDFEQYPEEMVKPQQEALDFATALPSIPQITSIRQAIFDNLVLALSGDMTAEDAILQASDVVNGLLQKQ